MERSFPAVLSTVLSVSIIFVIATIFFKFAGPLPLSISQTTTMKSSTFDVVGEGVENVVPDEAQATFGITTSAGSVAEAQNNANTVVNKLTADLKALGIDGKDIKTSSYNVSPNYSFNENVTRITGYNVTATVLVKFKDFTKLNQAFDIATQAGANLQGQLAFTLSEETRATAEDKARQTAIKQAKEKAQKIAGEAGISLGKIINVQESPNSYMPMSRSLDLQAAGSAAPTEISPGTSEVRINVILSYETR